MITIRAVFHDVRWQCGSGHFIAESAIQCEDTRDDFAYYGVRTRMWANCKVCGEVENLRLVEVGQRVL
jgi:hypothetical protein